MSTRASASAGPARPPSVARAAARAGRWGPRLLLVIVVLLAAPSITFDTRHVDAVAYLGIADAYAEGRWVDAVNGYWSPLLSWLLAPFRASGLGVESAFVIVNTVAAVAVLAATQRLALRAGATPVATAITATVIVPFVAFGTLRLITPDVLFAAVVAWYLVVVTDREAWGRPFHGYLVGLIGAACFLTRAMGLPLVIVHLALLGAARLAVQTELRQQTMSWLARATAAFSLVAGGWIAAISLRYGELTITAAGRQNIALSTRPSTHWAVGTREPVTPGAIAAWQDPALIASRPGGEADIPDGGLAVGDDGHLETVRELSRNLPANLQELVELAGTWPLLSAVLVLGMFWLLLHSGRVDRVTALIVLAAVVVYTSGTLLTIVHERYVWWTVPPLAAVVTAAFGRRPEPHRRRAPTVALVTVAVVVLAVQPLARLAEWTRHDEPLFAMYADEETLALLDGDRVASDGWGNPMAQLCLRAGCQYLGVPVEEQHDDIVGTLVTHQVRWFVAWDGEVPFPLHGRSVRRLGEHPSAVVIDVGVDLDVRDV